MYRGRRQGSGLGLLLLAAQVMRFGIDRIPPITLSCLAANVLIFLGLIDIPSFNQPLSNVCISALHIWHAKDYSRLLLASFFHSSDFHLYYNMASFLWKGTSLENRIGSVPFAFMLAVFTIATNIVYVALGLLGQEFFEDPTYLTECAVGFSGVIFALKVVTTHYMSSRSYILGFIPVPTKYAVWAELLLIHLLVPHTSFLGHLAGIIVGTLYVYGPLQSLMDIFITTSPRGYRSSRNIGYTYGTGFSGYANNNPGNYDGNTHGYNNNRNAYNNHPPGDYGVGRSDYGEYTGGLSEEQQVSEAIRLSQQPQPSTPPFSQQRQPSAPPFSQQPQPSTPSFSQQPQPSAPPPTPPATGLYPQLPGEQDDMRRSRLRRFDASH